MRRDDDQKRWDDGLGRRDDRVGFGFATPVFLLVTPAYAGVQLWISSMKLPCVYILASRRQGTLYIGVTSDLLKRVWEHRNDAVASFTSRYGVHDLVWHEVHETMESAIAREKTLKEWKRVWKIDLIEQMNPEWRDLYLELV